MRIAYIVGTLATQSGANRMVTEKANIFAAEYNYDVTIITCVQHQDENDTYSLYDTVKQVDLEIPLFAPYKYKYPKKLWVKWSVNRLLHKKVTKAVQQINPDILIGLAQYKAEMVCRIKCRAKKIIECHEARPFTLSGLGRNLSLVSRILLNYNRNRYFRTIERNADVICPLTEGDKEFWKKAKRIEVIPNFSTMRVSQYSDCTQKRIIAVGRLEWEKGYSRLINVWKIVSTKHPDWQLDIFGEGEMENVIRIFIKRSGVKNITIHKFTSNISIEYANSSICLLTSYFEGFSLVLLEAQRHGVPCVAFDCPFGPRSIINDSYSGFLVHNGDIRVYADRVCRLIEDENLRKQFSKVGIEHAKTFDINNIIQKWKSLFEDITAESTT